ncbi:MAG: hypothetical protein KBD78_00890 [Oligoflexales bacterium]|nr:hypothetical protein [Oligoflexales bacterium]
MKIRFTGNIAINTLESNHKTLEDFYKNLGLESKNLAENFSSLEPSPFACFLVSWDPKPKGLGEICLQLETDDIISVHHAVIAKNCEVLFFGDDPNNIGKRHLWFRDPSSVLVNVIEEN